MTIRIEYHGSTEYQQEKYIEFLKEQIERNNKEVVQKRYRFYY